MSLTSFLVWLLTFGFLGWAASVVFRSSRAFAASPLAGQKMRQVTGLYVPLLEIALLLSLLGLAFVVRSRGRPLESALSGGAPFVLMLLAVLLALATPVVVAVQGFTLSERQRSRGDLDAADRLRSRGMALVLLGAASVLITIFAALLIANPAV